jgi:poly-gamma-glutamate synthesis protein (capsule biosynthesis protein)
LAAAGEAILTRSVRPLDAQLTRLRGLLLDADAAFVNLELACPRRPLVPALKEHGIHISAPEAILDDLQWLGFDLVSVANNHALDYGPLGLEETMDALKQRGMVHAGAGRSLVEARQPAYLDTGSIRIALLAVTTTWAEHMMAADGHGAMGSRTGINPLRYSTSYGLTPEHMAALANIKRAIENGGDGETAAEATEAQGLAFLGRQFQLSATTSVLSVLNRSDMSAIGQSISAAREQADLVAVSIHFHESPHGRFNESQPAEHIRQAAHHIVDAGADVVLGHGPHQVHGIEIYAGKPILYSLGNLFFTLETIAALPRESYEKVGLPADSVVADYIRAAPWVKNRGKAGAAGQDEFYAAQTTWEGMLAVLTFDDQRRWGAELWPLDLGLNRRGITRGIPVVATGPAGHAIMDRVAQLSAALGGNLHITARDGITVGTIGPI